MTESSLSLSVVVVREAAADAAAVERLAERAFGPGRFARTAYRLREVAEPDWDLCFVARVSTLLVGANRMTPIRIGEAPALMLGPLTVDPAFRSRGIAAGLASMAASAAAGLAGLLLALPTLQLAMKSIGSLYLLWLAWQIARRGAPHLATGLARPTTFAAGLWMLWHNPKGWAMTVGAAASFAALANGPIRLGLMLGVVFGLAAAVSLSI